LKFNTRGYVSTTNLGDEKIKTLFIMYHKCSEENIKTIAKEDIAALSQVFEESVFESLPLRDEMNYAVCVRQAWR
jgi:hypothetical protein